MTKFIIVCLFVASFVIVANSYEVLSEKNRITKDVGRIRRSPEEENDAEGRHLHKLKHKLKPHKFGHYYGGGGGLIGNPYPVFGGAGYPGIGSGCRKCGGLGWNRPQYGGPIATAIAGGGWNPGGGFGFNRPHSQAATWNLGPFQASFGFANAG